MPPVSLCWFAAMLDSLCRWEDVDFPATFLSSLTHKRLSFLMKSAPLSSADGRTSTS